MFGRPATGPARELEPRTSRSITLETLRSLLSISEEMTLPQVRALLLLSTRGAQTVKSLAEGLSSHEFTIDRLCTRLVTRGLLVRVPAAANPDEFVVALSTAGRRNHRRRDLPPSARARARRQANACRAPWRAHRCARDIRPASRTAEAERRIPKMNARIAQEER